MPNQETLATVASIIAGFGAAMLAFRFEREAEGLEEGQTNWVPWADGLLIAAILICLLLVIFPIVSFAGPSASVEKLPQAACSVNCVLLSGYILAMLAPLQAHFRMKTCWGVKWHDVRRRLRYTPE